MGHGNDGGLPFGVEQPGVMAVVVRLACVCCTEASEKALLAPQVRVLLDWGANVGPLTESQWTPLHAASYGGHAEVAQRLLMAGADPSPAIDDGGWTALHMAALHGHHCVVDVRRRRRCPIPPPPRLLLSSISFRAVPTSR